MAAAPQFGMLALQDPDLTVSVVIPALNEARNLPYVLPRIPDWVDEVLLVDGRSTDNTVEVARAVLPRIKVVNQTGRGKGNALREGVAAAKGDIIVLMDADGSTDPQEIPAFVGALLAGADFAKGSRFLQGARTDDMPLIRRIGNSALVVLGNIICGTRFTDITYGYNAFWRHCAGALALEIDGWACEIVSNLRVARSGYRVSEVASFERPRIAGIAKLSAFSAGVAILGAMLREAIAPKRETPAADLRAQRVLAQVRAGAEDKGTVWDIREMPRRLANATGRIHGRVGGSMPELHIERALEADSVLQ